MKKNKGHTGFNNNTQFYVIYGVEDLLNNFDHEKYMHRSSELNGEIRSHC